jgi:dCMP deaminase
MKGELLIAHMRSAKNYGDLSHSKRKRVGCIVVKDNNIISIGLNGTLPGEDNCCEDPATGLTHNGVIHAEMNAMDKLAKTTGGAQGSTVFVTAAPCYSCAVRLANVEIKELYYGEIYRGIVEGIELLQSRNIPTYLLTIPEE